MAELAVAEPQAFGRRLGEFADTFYLAETDAERQACLDPMPDMTSDPLTDAWIGASGEHLARRWGLEVPDWPDRPCHFRLEQASYHPPNPAVAAILFVESPPAFRRRRLFVMLEPLMRARFPVGRRAVLSLDVPVLPDRAPVGDEVAWTAGGASR